MIKHQASYHQILKATSLFGGVKVFSILIAIIRSKIIAILLGPTGIGLNGLLSSTTGLIAGFTNFGLETSAVKNVAAAYGSGDKNRIGTIVAVLRNLVWITGLLGTILTIVLAPLLSQLTFGNKEYTIGFIWISITLLLNQISIGQGVVLRGMRQLKLMAKSSLSGSIIGLLVSVPIYYYWGIDGIVPAIIVSSVVSLLRTWYFSSKVEVEKVPVTWETTKNEGKDMLTMGLMLSISSLYVLAKSYGIRAFISNLGGLDDVGLYTAGFAIVNSYVGMVFTAMSTDYFPRLSAVASENVKACQLINQQAEISILILAPIVSIFLIFVSWLVVIFYSNKFLGINEMIQWAMLGVLFKTASFSIAFVFLAKGESKLYLANELFAGTVTLILYLLGYYLDGLRGLGISFLLGYLYYTIQVYIITNKKYGFNFTRDFTRIFIIQGVICISSLITILVVPKPLAFILGSSLIITSVVFSYYELNKRIGLNQLVKRKLRIKS